jgi:hypothetical protein
MWYKTTEHTPPTGQPVLTYWWDGQMHVLVYHCHEWTDDADNDRVDEWWEDHAGETCPYPDGCYFWSHLPAGPVITPGDEIYPRMAEAWKAKAEREAEQQNKRGKAALREKFRSTMSRWRVEVVDQRPGRQVIDIEDETEDTEVIQWRANVTLEPDGTCRYCGRPIYAEITEGDTAWVDENGLYVCTEHGLTIHEPEM